MGMMSDVNMWNRVLTPSEIYGYEAQHTSISGNVLNWEALEFQIVGRVLIENKQMLA